MMAQKAHQLHFSIFHSRSSNFHSRYSDFHSMVCFNVHACNEDIVCMHTNCTRAPTSVNLNDTDIPIRAASKCLGCWWRSDLLATHYYYYIFSGSTHECYFLLSPIYVHYILLVVVLVVISHVRWSMNLF